MFKWSQKAGISDIAAFISVFCAFKWSQKAAISDIAGFISVFCAFKWSQKAAISDIAGFILVFCAFKKVPEGRYILYKMVCQHLSSIKWFGHGISGSPPPYKLDRSKPILYKMVCHNFSCYKVKLPQQKLPG